MSATTEPITRDRTTTYTPKYLRTEARNQLRLKARTMNFKFARLIRWEIRVSNRADTILWAIGALPNGETLDVSVAI